MALLGFVFVVARMATLHCDAFHIRPFVRSNVRSIAISLTAASSADEHHGDLEIARENSNMELAWRSIKKPLMSIGAKGVATSHANSLSELLAAHQVVKVKIRHVDGFEAIFAKLAEVAQQEMELLQYRESDGIAMIGAKGSKEMIEDGRFPPHLPASDD